jgi:hypothetical protein
MHSIANNENAEYQTSSKLSELRVPDVEITKNFTVAQTRSDAGGSVTLNDITFSIKPYIVMNRSNVNIPFSRTGKIRVSCNLSNNLAALVDNNAAAVASLNYELTNVKLNYRSVPDSLYKGPITFQKIISIKTTVESGAASISSNVPSTACSGVAISFQPLDNENKSTLNNYQLTNPHVNSVEFLFNSANSYINYKLEDQSEMMMRGLSALAVKDTNSIKNSDMMKLKNYIIGTGFNAALDLSKSNFEVQINSEIVNSTNVYLYFKCMTAI